MKASIAAPWIAAALLLAAPGYAWAQPCGDGVRDPDEACDLGIGNEAGESCTQACTLAVCGDGIISLQEACDDANAVAGDGCGPQCRDESQPRWSVTIDRDAQTNEWFGGVERSGDTIYVLGQASEAWQQWSSTLIAYDPDGNEQWQSFFGPEPFNRIGDFAIAGDRLFVGGRRFGSAGGTEAVIGAYTLDGSIVGESPLLGIGDVTVVLVGPDGDLFLGGQLRRGDVDRWFGRYSVTEDAMRWSTSEPRVGGTENVVSGAYDPDAGLFFSGEVGREAFAVRLDPDDGALLWEARPHEGETAFGATANGLALAGDHVVIVGTTTFPATARVDWHSQGWVEVFGLDGSPAWSALEVAAVPGYDGLTGVDARDDGSFVVAGYQTHEGLVARVDWDVDGLLVEYGADGSRGRELRYDGPLHHEDNFYALRVLDEDRVLVVGNQMALASAQVGVLAEFELPPISAALRDGASSLDAPASVQRAPMAPFAERLYLDFDGASLRPGADGRLEQMSCLDGPLDWPGLDEGQAFVEATVQQVRQLLEPYDVTVLWQTRPDPSLPYTTVLVGGAPQQLGFDDSTQGYACQVDCENQVANELVLAFASGSAQALASTIVHEAAHAWGLDHVVDPASVMAPFSPADDAALLERCVEVSDATSTPVCLQAHADFCPAGQQDDHAELLARFGESRPDLEAPTLLGLPVDTVELQPGEPFALSVEVQDDGGNPGLQLRVPGLSVRKTLDPNAPAADVFMPEGEHTLQLRALDHAGNETVQEITVLVVAQEDGETDDGSETTEGPQEDDTGDAGTDSGASDGDGAEAGCGCATREDRGSGAMGWLVIVAAGLVRRRRR